MKKNKLTILIILVLAIALFTGGYFLCQYYDILSAKQRAVICTKEAKICPDGSIVERIGPDCEFAPCPDYTKGWQIYKNEEYGFEMKYPKDFFDENQQPKLLIGDCNYEVFPEKCPNINDIIIKDISFADEDNAIKNNASSPGYWDNPEGDKQIINNVTYCLYSTGEATSGHAFNYYYFATVKNNKCLVIYLATSIENCDFYLPLKEENTEEEKRYNECLEKNKNQPKLLNEIINTFKFNK